MKNLAYGDAIARCSQTITHVPINWGFIMKVSGIWSFFMISCLQLLLAREGKSQKLEQTRIALELKDESLSTAFRKIEQQTTFRFAYRNEQVAAFDSIRLEKATRSLQQTLQLLLTDTGLGFMEVDGNIVILSAPKSGASPETKPSPEDKGDGINATVKGRVVNEKGEPLPGVSVKIRNTNNGGVTDANGYFELNAPDDAVLIISYIGYEQQEVRVGRSANLNIRLEPVNKGLNEVIVVGYGTQRKKDVTGAVSSIKTDELPVSSNSSITHMLAGRAAGLTVTQNSAQPGGGVTVLVRGAASTGAGNEPLYVLDGFPLSNDNVEPGSGNRYQYGSRDVLSSISPYDIASIEVLKDASATAIYGARAANGVVLITTKKGKLGRPVVSYNGNYSVQQISKKMDLMNAKEFMTEANRFVYEKWLVENKIAPYGNTDPAGVTPYTPWYGPDKVAAAGAGTDWYDLVTRQGSIQQHNVSVSGGSDGTRYLVSGNYFNQAGVVKNSDFTRYAVRTNLEQKLSNRFTMGLNLMMNQITNSNVPLGTQDWENAGILTSALTYDPTIPVRDANGKYMISPGQASMPNPVSLLEVNDVTVTKRLLGNVFMTADIVSGLQARMSVGIDNQIGKRTTYLPRTTLYGSQVDGQASINENNKLDKLFNATLNYKKTLFDDKHSLDALVGYEYQEFMGDGFSAGSSGFFTDAFLYNSLGAGEVAGPSTVGSYKDKNKLASYFGRVNYTIAEKYYLTLTGRIDGSTKFGANNKYAFFPSAAFSWRVIEEPFMKQQSYVSDLKLRLSYGSTGNQNIGQNALAFYQADWHGYVYGNNAISTGAYLSQIANPNLKWETTTGANIGLDFGLLNNRITGSVDYYQKVVKDLLAFRRLPSFMQVQTVADNIGKTQSKGWEFALHSQNLEGAFRWNTDITFTRFVDTWKERNPDVVLALYEKNSDPIRARYGYLTDGLLQVGEKAPAYMPALLPGQEKLKDVNGDGKLTQEDQQLLGTTDPGFSVGFGNSFSYKNFDLNIFFYGMFDRKVYNANRDSWGVSNVARLTTGYNLLREVKDRWAHDNTGAYLPSGMVSPYPGSAYWLWQNGGFLRCKSISLGYNLPAPLIKSVFSKCRIYTDLGNPFVFTRYTGIDPETDSKAGYPNQRTYSFGIDVTF
ncbi:SusC/RagA family TonB-linked outer membrane protein [Chitinophaga defluvii]|uniref:TonB-dependent receptor n=1 Tax=Chitinophaga defluvii TaxID=3163343 RepID=A0ABV2T3A8_9BACT